jgi:hypothetical protein
VQVRLNAFIPRVELLAAQRAAQGGYLVLERPTMGDYFVRLLPFPTSMNNAARMGGRRD